MGPPPAPALFFGSRSNRRRLAERSCRCRSSGTTRRRADVDLLVCSDRGAVSGSSNRRAARGGPCRPGIAQPGARTPQTPSPQVARPPTQVGVGRPLVEARAVASSPAVLTPSRHPERRSLTPSAQLARLCVWGRRRDASQDGIGRHQSQVGEAGRAAEDERAPTSRRSTPAAAHVDHTVLSNACSTSRWMIGEMSYGIRSTHPSWRKPAEPGRRGRLSRRG